MRIMTAVFDWLIQGPSFLIASGLNLVIAGYVFARKRHDIVGRSFFLFVVGGAVWIGSIGLIYLTKNFFFNQFVFYGAAVMFPSVVFFTKVFPDHQRLPSRFFLIANTIPAVVMAILAVMGNIVVDMIIHADGSVEAVHGPGHPAIMIISSGYFLSAAWFLTRNFRRSTGVERLQFLYLLSGVSLLVLGSIVFGSILPVLGYPKFNALGPICSVLFTGVTGYAIIRHRLLDIRPIIQRSLIYSSLLILIIGFYLTTVWLVEYVWQQATHTTTIVSAAFTTLLGIFGVPYIEHYFRKWTDPIFYKDRYDYGDALRQLSRTLQTSLDTEEIVTKISSSLKHVFRAQDVSFTPISDTDAFLSSLEIRRSADGRTCEVPVVVGGNPNHVITLDKKRSGDAYTEKDVDLLETLSYQISVALERAQLYQKVKTHADDLEQQVRERTIELKHAQKSQEQMMLDISHGLQTPLTIITGEIDFLKRKIKDNKQIIKLEKSINQLSQVIYDFLHLAKLEVTTDDVTPEVVNASELMREMVEYFEVIAAEKEITLMSEIAPDATMLGSKKKFEELVSNLVSNAMKYAKPTGDKQIYIGLSRAADAVTLTIRDTGVGIAEKDLPHIFERFYRVAEQEHSPIGGSGLGLAIVKEIVKKLRGVMVVDSKLGVGTTFTITFPRA